MNDSPNDKPPERGRRTDEGLRRAQSRASAVLLIALGVASALLAQGSGSLPGGSDGAVIGVSPWVPGAAVVGILFLCAVYSSAEAALQMLKPMHLKLAAERKRDAQLRLQRLLQDRNRHLAATTLAIHTLRLSLFLVCLWLAPGLAEGLGRRFGWTFGFVETVLAALALLLPIALAGLIVEMVPRAYAEVAPHQVALAVYRPILAASVLFSPIAKLVAGVATVFTARFGRTASLAGPSSAEEEIKTLVDSAQETGDIETEEKEMLHSVFEFADTVAREVMTPRVDMDAVSVDTAPEEVVRLIRESGHSRIPVYEETDDQIVGIVHAKDLLMAVAEGKPVNLRRLMRPALFVPENKPLHELLKEMRASRSQMAVVQDEFGGTAGIVTTEDIVEELVGDIVDEYDSEEPEIVDRPEGWSVEGKTHLDDLNHRIGSNFESEEFDTIGGYVFGLFGRQPKQGETIEAEGFRFTVESTDGRRIQRLLVVPRADEPQEPGETSERE